MDVRSHAAGSDLVPLAERVRHLRRFRGLALVLAAIGLAVLPGLDDVPAVVPLLAAFACLGAVTAVEAVWLRAADRARWLFGAAVLADACVLVWLAFGLTPEPTVLRGLLGLHVVAVALLASFRTGIKLAAWYSLLLLALFHAGEAGVLGWHRGAAFGDGAYVDLLGEVVLLWLTALLTAAFSAANERELRRRRFDLEALGRLSLDLEHPGDATDLAARLARAVAEDFDLPRVAVLDEQGGRARLLHGCGDLGAAPGAEAGTEPGDVLHAALRSQRPLLVRDLADDRDELLGRVLPGAANLILVPLHAEQRAVGVLVAEHGLSAGSRVERRVVSMLERYASQAALALTNAGLLQELEAQARVDALTGLANRRTFDGELGRELARSKRTGDPVTLLLLDIDHFKRLNDTFGHVAGDAVLAAFGRCLSEEARAGDTAARYGGEEFAVVLPGVDAAEGVVVADRLRQLAAGLDLDPAITVSVGVASTEHAADAISLVAAADSALYAAKAAGRNAVRAVGTPAA